MSMDATDDLIAHLSTRIGMILEDASAVALDVGNLKGKELEGAIAAMDIATTRVRALLEALKVLAAWPEAGGLAI